MTKDYQKPGEIVTRLWQVTTLMGQGKPVVGAILTIGVTEPTYYRWRAEYGGLKLDQVRRLKLLEQGTTCRASNLSLDGGVSASLAKPGRLVRASVTAGFASISHMARSLSRATPRCSSYQGMTTSAASFSACLALLLANRPARRVIGVSP